MVKRHKVLRQIVSDNCADIWNKNWIKICNAGYPQDVKARYGGYMVNEGDAYSAFNMENKPTTMLIMLHSKLIDKCKAIELLNSTMVKCYESHGSPQEIPFPRSRVTCMNYAVLMADALAEHCSSMTLRENQFAAIFYTEYQETENLDGLIQHNSNCSVLLLNIWCIILMALVALFCIYRFR